MLAVPCRPPQSREAGRWPPGAGSAGNDAWAPCRCRAAHLRMRMSEASVIRRSSEQSLTAGTPMARCRGIFETPGCELEQRLQRASRGHIP